MAQQQTQDQHFVPKTYLNGFTNRKGKLIKLKKDIIKSPRPKEIHPSAVCYKPDFYKFNNKHPITGYVVNNTNVLEENGFLYENNLRKLIEKVTNTTEIILLEDAIELAVMLFDLKMRNWYVRENSYSKQNMKAIFDEIVADHERNREDVEGKLRTAGIFFERFKEIADGIASSWTNDEDAGKELHNLSILQNKINPSDTRLLIYNKLVSGRWLLFKSTLNHQFITSDNPGFCADPNDDIQNTKFGETGAFYFPLTPYHLLGIFFEGDELKPLPDHKTIESVFPLSDWVKIINRGTWGMASKEVYGSNESSLLQTLYSIRNPAIVT